MPGCRQSLKYNSQTNGQNGTNQHNLQAVRERKGHILKPDAYEDRSSMLVAWYPHTQADMAPQGWNRSLGVGKSLAIQHCWGWCISQPNENWTSIILHTFCCHSLARCKIGVCTYSRSHHEIATGKGSANEQWLRVSPSIGIWWQHQFCNWCLDIPKPLCICHSDGTHWGPRATPHNCSWYCWSRKGMASNTWCLLGLNACISPIQVQILWLHSWKFFKTSVSRTRSCL